MGGVERFTAGLIQLTAPKDKGVALDHVLGFLHGAADAGADLLLTPENTSFMVAKAEETRERVRFEGDDETLAALRAFAKERAKWLVIGSLPILLDTGKIANRQFVISDTGDITARYDKLHLFDVDLPNGERYRESQHYAAGARGVIAETPYGKIGMSICYDVRFPYLYRLYALNGAEILTIPAAFTKQTGEAHWHILQRARAIETGCFVLSAAQTGLHENGRETFGHAICVNPWGEIVADAGVNPCFTLAEVDRAAISAVRSRIPALLHTRDVTL